YKNAIECYQKMLQINPKKKLQLNYLFVSAYMILNQNDKALQIIKQSILEYPDHKQLLYLRAQILLKNNEVDLAKKCIDTILLKDSTDYTYNDLLTQYYIAQGNKQLYLLQKRKNLQLLINSLNKNKENIDLIFEIASTYMSLKEYKQAETYYNLILDNFPNNYEVLKQKAVIALNTQHWSNAISIYNQLEANYSLEEGFCNNKAIAYIQIGNYSKALEYFDKTIQLNPNNKDAVFNRNKLRLEKKNKI
ncbi:MAG: tetratricopeptide repeat protein, partial [Prolixibacteraceae bacterium]|nr:tetratricopeptide repeat protein [Prolixibacteraceae bacterium]